MHNFSLRHIRAVGITKRLEQKWIGIGGRSQNQQIMTPQVQFSHITGILIMLSIAVVLSFLIMLGECAHYKYFRKPPQEKFIK